MNLHFLRRLATPAAITLFIVACTHHIAPQAPVLVVRKPVDTGKVTADNSNLLLGNPSGATPSISDSDNYLYDHGYYVESYNRDRGEPNWVSWYVGDTSLGPIDRSNDFRPDSALPAGWHFVQANSYAGSGFDRGHNCPSGDRTNTAGANESTFLMDNMIPQAPNNNEHTWANLEDYGRSLVKTGDELFVVMGSYRDRHRLRPLVEYSGKDPERAGGRKGRGQVG